MSALLLTALLGLSLYVLFRIASFLKIAVTNYTAYMKVEGEPGHWFWGHLQAHQVPPNADEGYIHFLMRCCRKFNWRPFRMMVGPFRQLVVVSHPKDVATILKNEPKTEAIYWALRPWGGNGLLLAGGKLWLRNRRLLTPAFHFNVLKPYVSVFSSCADTAMKVMRQKSRDDGTVDVFDIFSRMTLDVMLQCAMTYKSNCQTERSSKKVTYVDSVCRLTELVIERLHTLSHHSDFFYSLSANGKEFKSLCTFSHAFSDNLIIKRRRTLEEKGAEAKRAYRDFIDILLEARDENGVGLSNREIRDEVTIFLLEGFDTTACGITFALYYLGKYPEYQEKVRQEVRQILRDGKTELEWDDLNSLTYLTQCLKESLRLCSPAAVIFRELSKDTTIGGRDMKKGQVIIVNILGMGRNPEFWENPEKYDPERMNPAKVRHPYAQVVFSAGPRNCIGQQFALNEMRLVVAKFLNRYLVETIGDEPIQRAIHIVLKPVSPIVLRFTPIE